jgi:hypothetical protein
MTRPRPKDGVSSIKGGKAGTPPGAGAAARARTCHEVSGVPLRLFPVWRRRLACVRLSSFRGE